MEPSHTLKAALYIYKDVIYESFAQTWHAHSGSENCTKSKGKRHEIAILFIVVVKFYTVAKKLLFLIC